MWRVCGLLDKGGASGAGAARPACKLLATLSAHTKGVYTLALSPDGKTLFSGGEDSDIMVWAVDGSAGTGRLLRSLEEVRAQGRGRLRLHVMVHDSQALYA